MAVFYVDFRGGSNVNNGLSLNAPFKDCSPINTGGLWNGNEVRFKRGSRGVVNSATRANVVAPSGCLITAYGDAAAHLPVHDGNGTTFNPFWVQAGSGITVNQQHVTRGPGSGMVIGPTAGNSLDNIEVNDCLVTENTQNATQWGTDGLMVGIAAVDGGSITNVRVNRVVARDNGGHGMKARGMVNGATWRDCVAIRSGLRTPAHGIGTSGVLIDLTATAAAWSNTGGTVGGGIVWERTTVTPYRTSNTIWYGVWTLGLGPTHYKFHFYAPDPANPPPGYCGIGAANTLRINVGALSLAAITQLLCVYARPENVTFHNCGAAWTVDANSIEGDGVYFDNGSYKCRSYDCWGIENQGHGAYLNDATECAHFRFFAYNNRKGGAGVTRPDGANIYGSTFVCLSGTKGIKIQIGSVRAMARMNQIIGASVGIWTNDVGSNDIVEDQNVMVNVTTARTAGLPVGARTKTQALPSGAQNRRGLYARKAAAAADLVK